MARTIMIVSKVTNQFWVEAINTTCYIINRCILRPLLDKTLYELLKGIKPNISDLRIFGCKCFIHNNGKNMIGKFDAKSDEGTFLGYSMHSKAYRVLNKWTMCMEEGIHVVFYEYNIMT